MRELHQEFTRHMTRASLHSETRSARPSLRSQRCFHSHSVSWTQSPSARPQGTESTKPLTEDTSAGQSVLRRWCSHSRGRNRSRWCQSSSPPGPSQCQPPSPSPPWYHLADKWHSHCMKHLHLQLSPHESRSRAQWDDATIEGRQPRRKQVRFDMDEELGKDPTLPPDLALFLVEGMAAEWDDAPSSSTPVPMDSPWSAPSENPQSHTTYMGGAWPKVTAKPSAAWPWLIS